MLLLRSCCRCCSSPVLNLLNCFFCCFLCSSFSHSHSPLLTNLFLFLLFRIGAVAAAVDAVFIHINLFVLRVRGCCCSTSCCWLRLFGHERNIRQCWLHFYQCGAFAVRVHHSAFWASNLVVMGLYRTIRSFRNFEIAQNIDSNFILNEISNMCEYRLRSFSRKVDLVLHIVAAHFYCLQRDITGSCCYCTPSHLRPQKPHLISLFSNWSYSSRWVDKEEMLAVRVRMENFGELI